MSWAFVIALVSVVSPLRTLARQPVAPRLARELEIWRWKRRYLHQRGRLAGNVGTSHSQDTPPGERRADAGVLYYGGRRGVILRRR